MLVGWPQDLAASAANGSQEGDVSRDIPYFRWVAQAGRVIDVGFRDAQPAPAVGRGDGVVLDQREVLCREAFPQQVHQVVHV